MDFRIDEVDLLNIDDKSISELLNEVFVSGCFAEADIAYKLFDVSRVKQRGLLLCAVALPSSTLAGMVIIVPPDSPACYLAQDNEAEMHLLGVKPCYRNHGLGKSLVEAAVSRARLSGYSKIILWTQATMNAAQSLYEAAGFRHTRNIVKNEREFLVYEKELHNHRS